MCEMKFLVEDDVRQLFARLCTGLAAALLAAECASWALCPALSLPLLGGRRNDMGESNYGMV